MLYKLSINNVRKSFKDYAIYFLTLILGVAIFYVFNAIESQTVLLDVTTNVKEIIKLMTNLLSSVSVLVSLILGFLIIYASRFLMKKRHKEFGIYMTLGMSKRKISMILFIETLLIGIISLIIGLGLGIILSQAMSILVANMFESDMTEFAFTISSSSCIKTVLYFGIMYLFVMIFNTYNISKCKLIDLIQANKKSEQIKLKNPLLCTFIFIIASIALGYAYYLVTGGFAELDTADKIFKPIIIGCISTFFIFWSLSGLLIKIFMSLKSIYYKGLNSFVLRQLSSKINTTVFSMTIICLMLFITICVLSSSLTVKNSMQSNALELSPVDILVTKRTNNLNLEEYGYTEEQIENNKQTINEILNNSDFNPDINFKEYKNFSLYRDEKVTLETTLGSKLDTIKNQYLFLQYETKEDIITLSDYNTLAKLYGLDTFSLGEDEYIIIADFESMVTIRNLALQEHENLTIFNHTLKPKYDKCQYGFIEIGAQHLNSGIIIVPDEIVSEQYKTHEGLAANYNANSKKERLAIEAKIKNLPKNSNYQKYFPLNWNSKIDILESSMGLGALVTFIGLYLGIIFLISSTAILALKELSESTENKERFRMLRKLGASEQMINKALFSQIALFFIFPLIIAIIHSIFGIMFCTKVLELLGTEKMFTAIVTTACFVIIIYGGYFLLTYLYSKKIIKNKI